MQLFERAELLTMVALLPYYILGYSYKKSLLALYAIEESGNTLTIEVIQLF